MDLLEGNAGRSERVEKHVLRRFELCQRLGKGSYGIVWKAIEKRSRSFVALKKCFDAFRNSTDAQLTYREVMYLTKLAGHDNIVRLKQVIRSESDQDLYLVFEFMETDLFSVLRADAEHALLADVHRKYIVYQLLKALKFMHSAELIHRDLKPSNVLMNRDCHVKLCDLGMTRSVAQPDGPSPTLTDYVATRWYRPPETLLGSNHYDGGVDMWALGCVAAELYLHRPLFPGKSTMNQVELILEVSGRPRSGDVAALRSSFAATMLEAVPPLLPKALPEMIPEASSEAIDFVSACIAFSPRKRCNVDNALRHPYVAEFHDPDDEPIFAAGTIVLDANDNMQSRASDYRAKLYDEIERRKQEARQEEIRRLKRPSTTVLTHVD